MTKFIIKPDVQNDERKLYLIPKVDFYRNYTGYCHHNNVPVASKINIGRHLSHLGIKVDAHLGSHGSQKQCISGVRLVDGAGVTYQKKAVKNKLNKQQLIRQRLQWQNSFPTYIQPKFRIVTGDTTPLPH